MEEQEFNGRAESADAGEVKPYGQEERRSIRDRVNGWGESRGLSGSGLLKVGYGVCGVFFVMAFIFIVKFLRVIM